jgi:aldose 1-epimerase
MTQESISLITRGSYTAEISNLGAALATLKFEDKNLIEPRLHSRYFSGEILAPWPNRIADGKYSLNGNDFQLNVNEKVRNNALHGLVFDKYWKVSSKSENRISLQITIDDSEQYPGILELEMTYQIDNQGLSSTLTATNQGEIELPYGASTHPYLMVPGVESVDDYILQIGASQVYLTDEARLLPIKIVDVADASLDFRQPAKIGSNFIDHAFKLDPTFESSVSIKDDSGEGVLMSFNDATKWVQIHTADRNGADDGRKSLAIEPMTCPPDSFNSGIDLVLLKPKQSHSLSWRISSFK